MSIQEAAQKIEDYWDDRASTFDKDHDTENIDAWKSALSRLLGYDRTRNVLDIGTGSGFIANMTSSLGYPTAGVDISLKMMKNGVRHAESQHVGTFFFKVPAVDLPFLSASVDNIVNCRLIWTMIDADSMVNEWKRILRPGGQVLCFNRLDAIEGLKRKDNKAFDYGDPQTNEALDNDQASTAELIDLFTRNGFIDVHVEHLPGLTRPGYNYQEWYVLIAKNPYPQRHSAELGMAAYWDDAAHRYDSGHMIDNIPAWQDALSKFIGPKKDLSILDVATGTGMIACTLGECGYTKITGVDLSEKMMRVAIDRAREHELDIPFIYGNAVDLPYPDESVDVIISCRLLWTLNEPSSALNEWMRVLRPGGRIIAINEFESDTIGCNDMTSYCQATLNDGFPWANASKQQIINETSRAGYMHAHIAHMANCHLANSERTNWYALIADKKASH